MINKIMTNKNSTKIVCLISLIFGICLLMGLKNVRRIRETLETDSSDLSSDIKNNANNIIAANAQISVLSSRLTTMEQEFTKINNAVAGM
jgi:hypothetical protein